MKVYHSWKCVNKEKKISCEMGHDTKYIISLMYALKETYFIMKRVGHWFPQGEKGEGRGSQIQS